MSVPLIMGSHGNFPFGYDPNHIHGIGLPSYINPQQQPQPQGQPLLNEQENNDISNFFSDFEAGGQVQDHTHPHHAPNMMAHYDNMPHLQPLQMPQTYVGHETSLQSPHVMDWHHQQSAFGFAGMPGHRTQSIPQAQSPYDNNHHLTSPVHQTFPMHQTNVQTYTTNWQQSFPPNHIHTRPDLHFGTDQNFVNSGYIAPEGAVPDNEMSILYNVMGPASTPSTTQPNTRPPTQPNTEPSSPVTNKKRKLNDHHEQSRLPNGAAVLERRVTEPTPRSSRKHRKSFVKHEQPPTPLSKTPTSHGDDEAVEEDDAEYDEDADGGSVNQRQSQSPPAPWPSSKARPIKVDKPPLPSKSSKSRKKSTASSSNSRPPKTHRTSSGTVPNATRVPLTAEQKKANHTNSEQRRRDATARAYAELYDLVPEIQEMGKQSTMKKLEVVVDKVRDVKARLEYLRNVMSQDLGNGRAISSQIPHSSNMAYLQGWR